MSTPWTVARKDEVLLENTDSLLSMASMVCWLSSLSALRVGRSRRSASRCLSYIKNV